MALRLAFVALAVWLFALSCGGSSGDDDDDGAGSSAGAEDFPARYADAWCGLLQRCCSASGGIAEDGCVEQTEAEVAALGQEAMADGASWDSAAAGLCLDAMMDADCAWVDLILFR